jgi:di/tricarboxylate transporter
MSAYLHQLQFLTVFCLTPLGVVMQVFGGQLGVAPVTAAMCALGVLLVSGVLSWQDCLEYKPAWDTLIWFTCAFWDTVPTGWVK